VHLFNAARFPLGRMATHIATIIRGKNKPTFTDNKADEGDIVVVVNAAKARCNGRKQFYKMYYTHTGYAGALKEVKMSYLREHDP
jgi:large subunit ribosomal protein L13